MVAKLMPYGDMYRCSNCYMRMSLLKERCPFCGKLFSNYEELLIKSSKIKDESVADRRRFVPQQEQKYGKL